MSANEVFRLYAQRIGVGAMAGAGLIGIIRALPTIVRAFSTDKKVAEAEGQPGHAAGAGSSPEARWPACSARC